MKSRSVDPTGQEFADLLSRNKKLEQELKDQQEQMQSFKTTLNLQIAENLANQETLKAKAKRLQDLNQQIEDQETEFKKLRAANKELKDGNQQLRGEIKDYARNNNLMLTELGLERQKNKELTQSNQQLKLEKQKTNKSSRWKYLAWAGVMVGGIILTLSGFGAGFGIPLMTLSTIAMYSGPILGGLGLLAALYAGFKKCFGSHKTDPISYVDPNRSNAEIRSVQEEIASPTVVHESSLLSINSPRSPSSAREIHSPRSSFKRDTSTSSSSNPFGQFSKRRPSPIDPKPASEVDDLIHSTKRKWSS